MKEEIIQLAEKTFAKPSILTNTGQLRIGAQKLLFLSLELGVHLSWHTIFQAPFAELRPVKAVGHKGVRSIVITPDEF